MTRANGPFEVQLTPQTPDDTTNTTNGTVVDRMSIIKQFHGDLDATSKGQMLAVNTDIEGSAGYVAMEQVSGALHVHDGTFVLQHNGSMTRGVPHLTVAVVPDSGTAQLAGLVGTMKIDIVEGRHTYEFEYTLPESR